MYISDFLYWENNRMTPFCNLFMERPSYDKIMIESKKQRERIKTRDIKHKSPSKKDGLGMEITA